MAKPCVIILAAGEGTRMKSKKPKVLAQVLFKPMIDWVIDSAKTCGAVDEDICIVTGHGRELLLAHLPESISTVVQEQRLGTGHAVMQAREFLKAHIESDVLILGGDAPFMDGDTVSGALACHKETNSVVTVISASLQNPTGYGRIVHDESGAFTGIVEEKDANAEEKAIREVNSGAYWFRADALLTALEELETNAKYRQNKAGEYYLTDAVRILREKGEGVATFNSASADVVLGANDRVQLAELNEIARKKIIDAHRRNGVSIPFADGVIICPDVKIGRDAEILRGTILKGKTVIAEDAVIGPDSNLDNVEVGEGAELVAVYGNDAKVGAGVTIGPFSRLRPGTVVGDKAHIGNFVEVKNSTIGAESKVSHLSYIGDTDMGSQVNVGCGCATANFTGKFKHRTTIGDHAFIGCDTTLVAPVQVGDRAYTAAGSVITNEVPDDALAFGRARQQVKENWVKVTKPYRD